MAELFNTPAEPTESASRARPSRGTRPPSLPSRTGVEWPLRADRGGCDPRLAELLDRLREQVDGEDDEGLSWVLAVACSWLGRDQLDRVAVVVMREIGELTGRAAA